MHEQVLRDFLDGECSLSDLAQDLQGSVAPTEDGSSVVVVPMDDEFEVTPAHLVRLCDAVIEGGLEPGQLETIAFCLIASDAFVWDSDTPAGAVVAETLFDWDSPGSDGTVTFEDGRRSREQLAAFEIRRVYRAAFRRQVVAHVIFAICLASFFVPAVSPAPIAVIVATSAFMWINLRCPSCTRSLARQFHPRFCSSCGAQLR